MCAYSCIFVHTCYYVYVRLITKKEKTMTTFYYTGTDGRGNTLLQSSKFDITTGSLNGFGQVINQITKTEFNQLMVGVK